VRRDTGTGGVMAKGNGGTPGSQASVPFQYRRQA
jgi:hypothetical protein